MYNLGLQLKAEGNPREALHWYAEALKVTPNNPEVLNNAGVALMALGDAQEAVRHYREAIRLSPDYALARNNLAGALAKLGDRRSAIAEVRGGPANQPGLCRSSQESCPGPCRRRPHRGRHARTPREPPVESR